MHVGASHTTKWQQPKEKLSGSFYILLGKFQGQLSHLEQTRLAKQPMVTLIWILVWHIWTCPGKTGHVSKKGRNSLQDLHFSDWLALACQNHPCCGAQEFAREEAKVQASLVNGKVAKWKCRTQGLCQRLHWRPAEAVGQGQAPSSVTTFIQGTLLHCGLAYWLHTASLLPFSPAVITAWVCT